MRAPKRLAALLAFLLIVLNVLPTFAVSAKGLQESEATTITQDSGSPPGTPGEQVEPDNEPTDMTPVPNVPPATPSDADDSQEPPPENDSSLAEPTLPEDDSNREDIPVSPPHAEPPLPELPIIEREQESGIPTFSAELRLNGENPGLYGTLNYIPENAMDIAVEYSFGGESYYFVDDVFWEMDEVAPEASRLTQLCMKLDERPYTVWQSGTVDNLYIRLSISCYDSDDIQTESILFSNQMTSPLPETPPPFAAEIVYTQGGYQVDGHFEDFPPDVVRLRPMYSLDGQEYKAVNELYPNDWCLESLGTEDEAEKYYLENQCCITYDEEPLASYVAGKLEHFYILLEITTGSGVYRTQAAVIERGTAKPVPEDASVKAAFPFTMRPLDEWGNPLDVTYGQYQITARAGATAEQVSSLLPDTLPLEVQLWQDNSHEMLTSGIVQVPIRWKTPSSIRLTAGEQLILSDAVDALVIPSGTEVTTPLGNFHLNEPVTFDAGGGQVQLVIDAVGIDEAPDASLQQNDYENAIDDIGALSLAFRLKPSGATKIIAYSFAEGDEDWTELCDLLDRRELNHNQAVGLYGFVTLLQPDDAPFQDYLSKGVPFLIGLDIEGGTFDGERVVLPWPGNYTPPPGIPEPGGSEGNEGNAGSGNGSGDSTEGGQRPDLPGDGAPPLTVPPPDTSNPPDNSGSGTTPSTPENPEPSVPSLPDGSATPSTPTDTPENGGGTVSPTPPANPDTILPTEEVGKDTPPPADQLPTKPENPAKQPPGTNHGNTLVAQNEPDNRETAASPTEPEVDKATELPVWNEAKPQEQPNAQTVTTSRASHAEKTGGLSVAAAVLLLGGGIAAVAVAGAGSAAGGVAGTSTVTKLITALKNFFRHP